MNNTELNKLIESSRIDKYNDIPLYDPIKFKVEKLDVGAKIYFHSIQKSIIKISSGYVSFGTNLSIVEKEITKMDFYDIVKMGFIIIPSDTKKSEGTLNFKSVSSHPLNYFWIIPLFPFFIIYALIIELVFETIYQVIRVIVEYVKTIFKDFTIGALIVGLLFAPITIPLAILTKILIVPILSIRKLIKRSTLLWNREFQGNLIEIFLWKIPYYLPFPD
jgi:hypothetical protein